MYLYIYTRDEVFLISAPYLYVSSVTGMFRVRVQSHLHGLGQQSGVGGEGVTTETQTAETQITETAPAIGTYFLPPSKLLCLTQRLVPTYL